MALRAQTRRIESSNMSLILYRRQHLHERGHNKLREHLRESTGIGRCGGILGAVRRNRGHHRLVMFLERNGIGCSAKYRTGYSLMIESCGGIRLGRPTASRTLFYSTTN